MINTYPFASGSTVTASFAITASQVGGVLSAGYVVTSSTAGYVINPISGSDATVNRCLITYEQYLLLINNPGTKKEQCTFSS
jgi:hypothetical protein